MEKREPELSTKIRFYPKADTIRNYIQTQLDDANKAVFDFEAKIEAASQPGALYQDITWMHNRVVLCREDAERAALQLMLLETHKPPEVMAELELEPSS